MNIDSACIHINVASPDQIQQLVTAQHAARFLHQSQQQPQHGAAPIHQHLQGLRHL